MPETMPLKDHLRSHRTQGVGAMVQPQSLALHPVKTATPERYNRYTR